MDKNNKIKQLDTATVELQTIYGEHKTNESGILVEQRIQGQSMEISLQEERRGFIETD